MSIIQFYFEGQNILIQCNAGEKMNQIFKKFCAKTSLNPNSVTFLYNGNDISNETSSFEQLVNMDDKLRNQMTILVANTPNKFSSEFIFETVIGADESMKDFAKMVILLAMKEYPDIDTDNYPKCKLIVNKFKERYGGNWSASFFKEGESIFSHLGCFIKIKYGNYIIKIARTVE